MRPGDVDFPLFLHVLGAMILVGGVLAGGAALAFARGEEGVLRLGYRALLLFALPGYILMRIGAEWVYSEEGWNDLPENVDEPAWLGIGYIIADLGGLLLLISLIVGGIGVRRLRQGRGRGLLQASMIISLVLLAAYIVAIWAMSGKPD
jgi:hypothetical protein